MIKKRILPIILVLALFSSSLAAGAAAGHISAIAECLTAQVTAPQFGSVGGEWLVFGLARSGAKVPEGYFDAYCKNLKAVLDASGGVLHEKKLTEYSRAVLALSAIGRDASDFYGYDLTAPLQDAQATAWQGINGAAFALLALDCRGYEASSREAYISMLLESRLSDGGFALSGESADADMTAMVLQALAKYRDRAEVAAIIEEGIVCLSYLQRADGHFATAGEVTCESTAQVLVALGELGISPNDPRFVKGGASPIDALLSFRTEGGFSHTPDGAADMMATEQALYALASIARFEAEKSSLYDMRDVSPAQGAAALPSPAPLTVLYPEKTFSDIRGNPAEREIRALAERGIINGKGGGLFDPFGALTRAEFAAITVRALSLSGDADPHFSDVPASSWFFPYAAAAKEYGIINGVTATEFFPNASLTREQAAAMVSRTAALLGMDTALSPYAAQDVLALFDDYTLCSEWARAPLAFCCAEEILDPSAMELRPKAAVKRFEIAQMLYNMLAKIGLID